MLPAALVNKRSMKMKRVAHDIGIAASTVYCAASTKVASAVKLDKVETEVGGNISTKKNILESALQVIDYILVIVGAIAVVFIIIGGFRYITSAGNDKFVEDAKSTITYAIIGLVIVLLAYVIVSTLNIIFA